MENKKAKKITKTKVKKVKRKVEETLEVKPKSKILDTLAPEHLKFLEDSSSKIRIAELEKENLEQILRNKHLELEIFKRDLKELQEKLARKTVEKEALVKNRTATIKDFLPLYGASEKFSYNPKTGAVIR